MILGLNL